MNLRVLIDQVQTEASHLTNRANSTDDSYRQQAVISLLARVPVLLSSAVYSSLLASGTPPDGIDNTLALGAGICGHHVSIGLAVLDALSIPCRDVQVFYRADGEPLNHTFVEVRWNGGWHMVDLTWGFIPHRGSLASALNFEEASRANHRDGFHHSAIPWRLSVESRTDIFGYLVTDADGLYYNGVGTAILHTKGGDTALDHPYIARAGSWRHRPGRPGEGNLVLRIPEPTLRLVISGTTTAPGHLMVDDEVFELGSGHFEAELVAEADITIRFSPEPEWGLFKIESIFAEPMSPREAALSLGFKNIVQ